MQMSEATILVVDDEPELCEIFAAWLSRHGCRVLTAPNGMEALQILASQPVHAMISDIRMPVMDGITLVRRIRELEIMLPSIIFVTGFGDIDVREAHAIGVEAMLTKPISRDNLLRALRNSLALRHELWLAPSEQTGGENLFIELPSLRQAIEDKTIQFGRGGFCLSCDKPLMEGPLDFSICFHEEMLELKGQGLVRWYAPKHKCAGVELVYLDPACREWVHPLASKGTIYSFIPHC